MWTWLLLLATSPGPEQRAIQYLAREVPQWSRQNGCFSCHNNGDGARALYAARRRSHPVPPPALSDTTSWLLQPSQWDNNRGDPAFSDKRLARIQFASSLGAAFDAGLVRNRKALVEAAERLLPHQDANGSWPVEAESVLGSPATYGAFLATCQARRALERAGDAKFREAIAKAGRWLLETPMSSLLDASAVVMAFGDRRTEALDQLLRGQTSQGGWGPYPESPPEPFDTAVALLALAPLRKRPEIAERIERGRNYLTREQLPSGGWTETTRPPGARSYAQHISTTGWATLALVETGAPQP